MWSLILLFIYFPRLYLLLPPLNRSLLSSSLVWLFHVSSVCRSTHPPIRGGGNPPDALNSTFLFPLLSCKKKEKKKKSDSVLDTQRDTPPGISQGYNMRSKIWWFTEFCNSHYVSHFAAFFIVARTKISIVKSSFLHFILFFICFCIVSGSIFIFFFRKKRKWRVFEMIVLGFLIE